MSVSTNRPSRLGADPLSEKRFRTLVQNTLFVDLQDDEQQKVRDLHNNYRFTVQEMRIVCEAARDLEMWREQSLFSWWQDAEQKMIDQRTQGKAGYEEAGLGRERKRILMHQLRKHLTKLKQDATVYPKDPEPLTERSPLHFVAGKSDAEIFGDCPVRSERTLCCNLKTIDAVQNCAFGCSYCTIQTFYGDRVAVDPDLNAKLQRLELEPDRFYHIGSGQSSDSLVWGNRGGILDALCQFATEHPNVLLELKTKSANVKYLIERSIPANVVCSWSLNTEPVVSNEEHFTASLQQRLQAARKVADCGIKVAFHFHPMVNYQGWEQDYPALVRRIQSDFNRDEVSFVSLGSVTFIKPVIKQIRRRGEPTRILQTDLVKDPHGKLTYSDDLKVEMFKTMYRVLAPWHGHVFIYLCMEKPEIWDRALGWRFSSNEEFENAFAAGTLYRRSEVTVCAEG